MLGNESAVQIALLDDAGHKSDLLLALLAKDSQLGLTIGKFGLRFISLELLLQFGDLVVETTVLTEQALVAHLEIIDGLELDNIIIGTASNGASLGTKEGLDLLGKVRVLRPKVAARRLELSLFDDEILLLTASHLGLVEGLRQARLELVLGLDGDLVHALAAADFGRLGLDVELDLLEVQLQPGPLPALVEKLVLDGGLSLVQIGEAERTLLLLSTTNLTVSRIRRTLGGNGQPLAAAKGGGRAE